MASPERIATALTATTNESIADETTGAGRARLRRGLMNAGLLLITAVAIAGLVWFFDSPTANSQGVTITAQPSGPRPEVGKPAPEIEGRTLDGNVVKLSELRGHPVWITFWATWCPPCRAENPDIKAAYLEHQGEGLVVLAVNLGEEQATVRDYVQRTGLPFPIALDGDSSISATYRIVGIPTHFFVDANGIVREQRIGSMSKKTIDKKLAALIAGK